MPEFTCVKGINNRIFWFDPNGNIISPDDVPLKILAQHNNGDDCPPSRRLRAKMSSKGVGHHGCRKVNIPTMVRGKPHCPEGRVPYVTKIGGHTCCKKKPVKKSSAKKASAKKASARRASARRASARRASAKRVSAKLALAKRVPSGGLRLSLNKLLGRPCAVPPVGPGCPTGFKLYKSQSTGRNCCKKRRPSTGRPVGRQGRTLAEWQQFCRNLGIPIYMADGRPKTIDQMRRSCQPSKVKL